MTDTLWKPNRSVIAYFFFIAAAGLLFIIIINIVLTGPSESAVLLGLSAERLALLGGIFIIFCGLTWLGVQTLKGKGFEFASPEASGLSSRRVDFLLGATLLVFISTWLMVWTPAERFGTLYYYIGRIYPFVVWLTCFSAVGLVLLLANRFGIDSTKFRVFLREQRVSLFVAGIVLLIFGFLAWAISFRVVNMRWQDEDFWYGAGVPLLGLQVLLALLASIGLAIVGHKFAFGKKHWPDLILFLLIWGIAAWLWATQPVNPDFFITPPTAPNFELYPDYDARFFDLVSQYALIGQGLNNANFFDRPLYSALLVYLHAFAGQDYEQIVALQAALFAIFPALGYLLGKRFHSWPAGIGLAILFTLRGINAIEAGSLINTAHQKQMMTDFPSAVLMLLMTVLLVRWLQEPTKHWSSLGLAAGVLGLATLLRPHPILYIPILVVLTIGIYRHTPRIAAILSSLILVAALAGVLPWLANNGQGRSVVDLYLERVKSVIRTRYPDLRFPGDTRLPSSTKVAAIANAGLLSPYAVEISDKSVLDFSIDNFLNNLATTAQILPHTPYYHDLRYTVKNSENFWRPYWDGSMSLWAKAMLAINLILVALGLGAAWQRARLSGLIPLMVMLAYYAMNAFARTSGGRYLVPVDWVVIVYYFLGILVLIEIVGAFFRPVFSSQAAPSINLHDTIPLNRITWMRILGVLIVVTMVGALIPLAGNIFEKRYTPLSRRQLIRQVQTQLINDQVDLTGREVRSLLSNRLAVILQGRILYTRQLEKDQGLDVSIYNFYHPKPYPRTIFTLIGPGGESRGVFPSIQAALIPNASDAIVLGCRESDYIQIWAVLLPGSDVLLKRNPSAPPVCPLTEPVCDDNHHCK